jgi:hypothetical protein
LTGFSEISREGIPESLGRAALSLASPSVRFLERVAPGWRGLLIPGVIETPKPAAPVNAFGCRQPRRDVVPEYAESAGRARRHSARRGRSGCEGRFR